MRKTDILRRNHVTVTGKGTEPLMFAHGFGCDQTMWRFITHAFEEDYKVILFDYVGSGRSLTEAYDPARYSTLEGYARDVTEILTALDLEQVTFVGHSVSSIVGALAACKDPGRFSRMIMIGPSPRYINDPPDYVGGFEEHEIHDLLELMEKNFTGWASFLAPIVMKNPDRPQLTEELEEIFCSSDPRITRRFAEVAFLSDHRADLSCVQCPTLILQCSDDSIAPAGVGEFVHQQIRGSEFRFMEATGHCPHMSHPEETITLMKEYLASRP